MSTDSNPEVLEHTLEQTLAQLLARHGDEDAVAEVAGWLDEGGNAATIAESAFEIVLARETGERERREVIVRGLHNTHYFSVRDAAVRAAGDFPDLRTEVVRHLFDHSGVVQRTARDAVLAYEGFDDEQAVIVVEIIRGTYVPPISLGTDDEMVVTLALPPPVEDEEVPVGKKLSYRVRARVYAMECVTRPVRVPGLDPVLFQLIDGDDGLMRSYAGRALPFAGDRDVVARKLIERLAADRPADLQLSALAALSRMRHPDAAAVLARYLEHWDYRLQRMAAIGMDMLGEESGIARLRDKWHAFPRPTES